MKNMKLLLIIFFLVTCTAVFGQEAVTTSSVITTTTEEKAPPATSKPRFDVGAGYWWTDASLNSYVYDPVIGGKISELNNNLDAGLFVINADAYLFWRLYVDAFIGWGNFEGDHKDSDWFLPEEIFIDNITWGDVADELGLDLSQPFSVSKSDADGNVVTWNANGYFRVIEGKEDKGFLDVSLGYIYYRDDIEHLRNSTLVSYLWGTVNAPIEGHDSQLKYTFDGFRLGARGKIRLHDRVAIKASGGIAPWATAKEEGYWNLREMNFDCEADATIYDFNAGLELKITKYLFIEGGYRYINLDSGKGDDKRKWSDGSTATFKDAFEADGHRGGFYLMGRLKI